MRSASAPDAIGGRAHSQTTSPAQTVAAATIRPSHVGEQEAQIRQTGPVDQVGFPAYRDVVAEPLRVFVRIGVTADPHDQRRVVGAVALRWSAPADRRAGWRSAPPAACVRRAAPGRDRWPPTAPPEVPHGSEARERGRQSPAILRCRPRSVNQDSASDAMMRCVSNGSKCPAPPRQMPRWAAGSRPAALIGRAPTGPEILAP